MISYLHICQPVQCPACKISSCNCKWRAVSIIGGINYHCPHCNNIMQSAIVTSSSTEITSHKR